MSELSTPPGRPARRRSDRHQVPDPALAARLNSPPELRQYAKKHLSSQRRWWRRLGYVPIAYKMALLLTLVVIVAMILLNMVVVSNQNQLMQQQLQEVGSTLVTQLANSSVTPVLSEDFLALRSRIRELSQTQSVVGSAVYDIDGQLLQQMGQQPEPVQLQQLLAQVAILPGRSPINATQVASNHWAKQSAWWHDLAGQIGYLHSDALSFMTPIYFRDLVAGYAVVSLSTTSLTQALATSTQNILIATLLLVLLISLAAFLTTRQLGKPIKQLLLATKAIDLGNYDYRITAERNDEMGILISGYNKMAEGLLLKSKVESVFSRYLSKDVASRILDNLDEVELGGKHIHATVLFADIVGFTGIAEKLPPQAVSELLNEYFSHITAIARFYGGSIDKFIGDCAMVVFGLDEQSNHTLQAISSAVLLQRLTEQLNITRRAKGQPEVLFRIGIHSGEMLAGNLGSADRMEFTVVGDSVNLASRLVSLARPAQTVMCETQMDVSGVRQAVVAEANGVLRVRGKTQPVTTYAVTDLKPELRRQQDQVMQQLFAVHLPTTSDTVPILKVVGD